MKRARARSFVFPLLVLLGTTRIAFGFTKTANVYTTDGSQTDVTAAIADSTAGDIVRVPAGTFVWGSGGFVGVNKAITLAGAGPGQTIITLADNGPQFGNAAIRISAPGVVRGFTINQGGVNPTTALSAGTSDGWRITNVVYNAANNADQRFGYFFFATTFGVVDNCTINTQNGSDEPIFARGPSTSWQTASTMGSTSQLYLEDCTFTGAGYVCDMNANSRAVIRFCTITGKMKVDGHGVASNSPSRSVRHMEIYGNHWTAAAGSWTSMEIRGGTGVVFNNLCDNQSGVTVKVPTLQLVEYGAINLWPNFGNIYQTLSDYPIKDQIGVGMDPKVAGSEPYYLWNNIQAGVNWNLTWSNPIPPAALTQYQTQTGNPTATYTMQDLIAADRDYFIQGASFNGTSGVGRGTKAQMLAITPTKVGVGFWVTDEADWNALQAGPDGQLYSWNGTAWVLKYTPAAYPHPLRAPLTPSSLRVSP